MAPNTSKSDECNNNHVHKTVAAAATAAAGLSLSKAAAAGAAAAVAPAPPAPSAPYFCCKGRQFHLYSGLMRHIKVVMYTIHQKWDFLMNRVNF